MDKRLGSDDGAFAGLRTLAEDLAARTISSVELVDAALERIAAADDLRAFRIVAADAARTSAAEADRRLAAGDRAPLLGVPVAIKDDMDMAGQPTAFGCVGTFEPKAADSEVVARLKAAGAVVVGKTNTPEFGQWPFTEGPGFGSTRNPWDLGRTPGGSSGGSAAAVAAGLVPAAVGSDGAGSVRIPAAWCHLVGVKPQRGRISTWPDAEAFYGLTCFGPLARTVDDAALLLDVLTGNVPGDLHKPPPPSEPFAVAARRPPGRLRIAMSTRIPFSWHGARLDPEIRTQLERIAGVLDDLGHDVEPADPYYGLVGASIVPRGDRGVVDWARRVPDRSRLDPRTRTTVRVARLLGGPVLQGARAMEWPQRRLTGRIFNDHDVVLAPTTTQPPLRIGACNGLNVSQTQRVMIAACPMAWPWNVLGWPAVNVPAGFTSDGLPVGVQLMGSANSEAMLLSLAAQLESVERWYERRPPVRAT